LTFVTNSQNVQSLSSYSSDSSLLSAIKSGKGGFNQGNRIIVEIGPIFGGTTPEKVTQDEVTGVNDIEKALIGQMGFPFVEGSFKPAQILEYDKDVQAKLEEFNGKSSYVTTHLFSQAALQDAFSSDI